MYITLFVGNFPFETKESELMAVFSQFGRVDSIKLISDRVTGRPRGFGFIQIERAGGQAAIAALHRADFGGRPLNVREAGPVRREITLADNASTPGSSASPDREADLFVRDYWLNDDAQGSARPKRQNSYNNYR
jgi:RNA recognition motif-containing protein